ncbi:MAG: alpha/beta fold hydrolase [Eggerthellaceae bacterium]|nr:alpha/beta fold hydrolase [Eggerthellaceae bacterium]
MVEELIVMRDDMRIYGKIQYPEGEGPFPVAVFSHGFGAARVYDSEMGSDFVQRGIAFVAFDFCGSGLASQSDGSMLDMSVLTEAADLEAVTDAVLALDKIDSQQLFLVGSSQGGYVSAYVAAKRPADVRALVLNFPAFCIGDDARERIEESLGDGIPEQAAFGGLPIGKRYLQDAMAVDIYDVIDEYDGDVLIIHGSDDEIVPPAYSVRAAQVYGTKAELVVLGGMRHGFRNSLPQHYHRAIDLAVEFVEHHL